MRFPAQYRTVTCLILFSVASVGCASPEKGGAQPDITAMPPPKNDGMASGGAWPPAKGSVVVIKPAAGRDRKAIRREEFKPLLEAVAKHDQYLSMCHAFVMTSTYEFPNGRTLKTISRIDQSKPPAERSDMLVYNNKPPTERQKNRNAELGRDSYGKKKKKTPMMPTVKDCIEYGSCHMEVVGDVVKYTFVTNRPVGCEFRFFI